MALLGNLWLATGYSKQSYFVYFAEDLTEGSKNLESSEADMKIVKVSEMELKSFIKHGKIKDAATVAAHNLFTLSY